MKRKLLIIIGVVVLCITSFAATYMHIETKEGKEDVYAVDDVDEVTFWNDPEISHAYVDLGLLSGTLWATCNIGATKPEEYGDYFAWGEIEPKEVYDWSTYKYATTKDGELDSLTKKYNESVGLSSLLPEDDAATANWGSECRMPDYDEMKELCDECYMVWTNNYKDSKVSGVIFYKAKSADDKGKYIKSSETPSSAYSTSNDVHVFFPTAGYRLGSDAVDVDLCGYYWSSLLYDEKSAYDLTLYKNKANYYDHSHRYYGLPVRAVCAQKAERKVYKVNFYTSDSILIETQDVMEYTSAKEVQVPKKVGFKFLGWSTSFDFITSDLSVYAVYNTINVDLGLPSGTLWATCNIGATKPEEYGDYFAWGETEPKEVYDWSTYKYATTKDGELDSLTKYNLNDGLTTLLTVDDAATANWGKEWRMPNYEEMKELCNECYMVWTNNYKDSKVSGVIFYKAKSADDKGKYIESSEKPSSAYSTSNDIHIFFPNAGLRSGADPYNAGKEGWYWSSLLYVENGTFEAAYDLNLYESNAFLYYDHTYRYCGFPVRAVCAQKAERKVYKVNFYTSDSILIETQDVMEYTSAKEVQGPKKVGFEFSGWSTSVKCVTSDLSVYAVYNTIYVDLGLRSGTRWAAFNVGATKPEEYGDYFAWGETEPKKVYDWSTYKYATTKDGKSYSKTKYISSDSLFTLLPEDDAATANWGEEWRMPTHIEMYELCNACYMVYTDSYNGSDVGGIIFYKYKKSNKGEFIQSSSAYSTSNDVHVFFPAAGFNNGSTGEGWRGSYWSSSALTLDAYNEKNPYPLNDPRNHYNDDVESYAYAVEFMDRYAQDMLGHGQDMLGSARYYGYSVRAVRAEKTPYVDLGLPSGTLWATSNVGATKPEEAGDYFAWGETEPKAVYDLSTYKYATTKDGKLQSYTRYNESDGLSTLLPEDDAVTANWGFDWRMPTIDEMKELIEYCDYKWTMVNGVYGAKYTGPSGESVFFPAVGLRKGSKVSLVGKYGNYWSSLLYVNDENYACRYYFDDSGAYLGNDGSSERYYGFPVRAVRTKK